jgi:ribosomal protein S6--L-glutamate ligase/gamma-F420-2:alpha-L-glutamate ligase
MMNKQGWIIYNGHLPGNKFLDFAEWIRDAAARKNSETVIHKNNELLSLLSGNELDLLQMDRQTLPAYVVFTDKDIYLAKQLELLGARVFNCAEAIAVSDDKILTYQQLAKHHIPMPKTIVAPKTFAKNAVHDAAYIQLAIDTFGFPMIVKEAFGSFGEQVYLIENKAELLAKVNDIQGKAFLFQEFITSSYGRDIRLHVVGDHVVAAMERQSAGDFRANITAGGTMSAYTPTDLETKLAITATQAIGADFAGVDLLYGPKGTPLVCEVNSNAHIRNMYDCTNINVADFMVDYILQVLKEEA